MSNTNNETTVTPTQTTNIQPPTKRGRGRPKGSKNRPKTTSSTTTVKVPNEISFQELK